MKSIIILSVTFMIITFQAAAQFTQPPLPYAYDALEPVIDAKTMEIHYSKHHLGYVNNLNKAIKEGGFSNSRDLENILGNISAYNTTVRNNAGGHYNHMLFWELLSPAPVKTISSNMQNALEKEFGSFEAFRSAFLSEASGRFGSGWVWLVVTPEKRLAITSTANQDNPLMDITAVKGIPILAIDVWEHAYYLKYQNRRADYLDSVWKIINWEEVERRYRQAMYE